MRRRRPPTSISTAATSLGCVVVLCALAWSAPLAAQQTDLRESIAGALVRPDQHRFVSDRWTHEPEIMVLYYGADWCAPCHAFVPELRRVRDALRAGGADTEVVFVSLDESTRDMHRYMRRQQMPWPAIDHRRLPALPAIRRLGGVAPPALVVIDRDGRVLDSAWDGRRYRGLQPVLATWLEHARGRRVDGQPGTERRREPDPGPP